MFRPQHLRLEIYIDYKDFHSDRLLDTDVKEEPSFYKKTKTCDNESFFHPVEVTNVLRKHLIELGVPQRYKQKHKRNWNNLVCVKINNFPKSVNF